MKEKLTVGFLTAKNPKDKKSWSGTHYRMYTALENEFDEAYALGPIKKPIILKVILLAFTFTHFFLFFKKFKKNHSTLLSKYYAYRINIKLKKKNIDVIFAPAASTEIAYLKTNIPICYLSDTSFGQISNYYSHFSKISRHSLKEANLIEQKAINNSLTQVYPSKWAAQYVINNYNAERKNVYTVKFGANIDRVPLKSEIKKDFNNTINILFLGVDWKRKGGDIMFKAFEILVSNGYDVSLTVCGCVPPIKHPKMTVIPFLNKNNKDENEIFINILNKSHILFLPTRAECYGIVFCEAAAYGIPVITTDTGGVTSIIENGINGFALPFEATPKDYADKIQLLLDYRLILNSMAINSRKKFEKELNWDFWGKELKKIILKTINKSNYTKI